MSAATLLFLILRVVHVLLAALWIGAAGFMVIFVFPSLRETGAAGGPMIAAIARRGLNAFMGALGGITALTGIYLYWRLTGHFDPASSATRSAMVFGTGGILGILAVIIGGAVVGRNARTMGTLGGKAMALPEGPERAGLLAQSAAARDRAAASARIVLLLQAIALVLMAIGHYV
jgi:hypothetical protein